MFTIDRLSEQSLRITKDPKIFINNLNKKIMQLLRPTKEADIKIVSVNVH